MPFFRSPVPGWSIEDLTHPDSWFYSSDILGPWDWKIDAIHDGIVYGKYLLRRSAFATEEMYRHLMNWRRSLPQYQFAQGGMLKAGTIDQRLQKYLSPVLLSAIREKESLESSEIRSILDRKVPLQIRKILVGIVGHQRKRAHDQQAGHRNADGREGHEAMGEHIAGAFFEKVTEIFHCGATPSYVPVASPTTRPLSR